MRYPSVLSEVETLTAVANGRSLARYGDGEFNACRGVRLKCQDATPGLDVRLREILRDPGECLVGIPNIHSDTPKATWRNYLWAANLLNPQVQYGSAFISRPDSAPWIDTPAYWALLESVWRGKDVVLVRGSGKSLTAEELTGAASVREVLGPPQHAYAERKRLVASVGHPDIAILCLGPTATVMAVDLCARGVHAVDLGVIGLFWRKHRQGLPMVMTREEKQKAWTG